MRRLWAPIKGQDLTADEIKAATVDPPLAGAVLRNDRESAQETGGEEYHLKARSCGVIEFNPNFLDFRARCAHIRRATLTLLDFCLRIFRPQHRPS